MTTHDLFLHRAGNFQPTMPFGTFQEQWLAAIEQAMRPATAASYRTMLDKTGALQEKPLDALTAADITALYTDLFATASPRVVNHLHLILHRCFDDAVQLGLIKHNPTEGIDIPGKQAPMLTILTIEEIRRLLQAVTDTPWEAFLTLAITTGIRVGELLALEWSQVDLEKGWLYIGTPRHQQSESAEKQRVMTRKVPLPKIAHQALLKHRTQQQNQSELVFPNHAGKTAAQVRMHALRDYCEIANCRLVRVHDLRNTCASLLIGAAVPPYVVGAILGYRFQNALHPLSPITDTMLREAANAIDQLFAGVPEQDISITAEGDTL